MFFEHVGRDVNSENFGERAAQFLNEVRNDRTPRTVQRYLGTLRSYGKWLGIEKPLASYRAPVPSRPQPHPIPEGVEAVAKMLKLARKPDHKALVGLCGLAGLRVGEATSVTVGDLDLVERTILVRGKGDRSRIVPLSDAVLQALAPRLGDVSDPDTRLVRLHERAARKVVTRLGERAGLVRGVASHDLRATFATAAYALTGDLRAVQELLGHADSRTTEVYTGISMTQMRAAADIMPTEEVT